MPKLSALPVATALASGDKLLLNQLSTSLDKIITAENAANSFALLLSVDNALTISELRAVDVTSLVTGTVKNVGGYYVVGDGGQGPFYYDSTSSEADNGGTVIAPSAGSGRWKRPRSEVVNVRQFGALGDGTTNDTIAIQAAINWVNANARGCVYIPSGKYKLVAALTLSSTPNTNISIIGDGPNVSILLQTSVAANGLTFNFNNVGVEQPYRLAVFKLGFESTVAAGTAIVCAWGNSTTTSSHKNGGLLVDNVAIKSTSSTAFWNSGIDITSGWNNIITNTTISGNDVAGVWANLEGSGIKLRKYCVNTHISDVQTNFFFTGLYYTAESGGNTEGLFCNNVSMVAVARGVWLQGNPAAPSPWLTGFQWIGGLIELRAGVAGIQLEACSQVRVNGVYIIDGATGAGGKGVYLGTCTNVVVSNNQFYAMDYGVITLGTCSQIIVMGNHFRGGGTQVTFAAGSTECRSSGNLVDGAPRIELNQAAAIKSQNKIYQGQSYGFSAKKNADQAITTATETAVTWQTVIYDDLDYNLPTGYRFFNPATPSRIFVPPGVTRVRVTVGIRWDTNAVGVRAVKIRTPVAGTYYPANSNWAADQRTASSAGGVDVTISTACIELDPNNGSYFDIVAYQTSGGNLNVRNVEGTYVQMEIIG
jgi:hypothetical protein